MVKKKKRCSNKYSGSFEKLNIDFVSQQRKLYTIRADVV